MCGLIGGMGEGAELAAAYWWELVGPLLGRELPGLRYLAGRLGSGSDVLGFDDPLSRDHDWGCRLTLLIDGADRAAVPVVDALLDRLLPDEFRGWPTRFATTWENVATRHRVSVDTVGDFARNRLGVDPVPGMSTVDWLGLTGQAVLEVAGGPVFVDDTTEWGTVQRRLAWYPSDVELYLLASGWGRLGQRLSFVGRCADSGQPLQSRLLAAGLVGDLIDLAFLLHRRWAPYEKWREAMFATLPTASTLTPILTAAVTTDSWPEREAALLAAVEVLADVQRGRGLPTAEPAVTGFYDRPYRTIADGMTALLLAGITDPVLVGRPLLGSVGQWVDCVDALSHADRRMALARAATDLPG